jgi:hypothetical protein
MSTTQQQRADLRALIEEHQHPVLGAVAINLLDALEAEEARAEQAERIAEQRFEYIRSLGDGNLVKQMNDMNEECALEIAQYVKRAEQAEAQRDVLANEVETLSGECPAAQGFYARGASCEACEGDVKVYDCWLAWAREQAGRVCDKKPRG